MGETKKKFYDLANNVVAACVFTGASVFLAILYTHFGPTWARPIMNGLIAGSIALTLCLSVRAILALPRAKEAINLENVGPIVLSWLLKFNLEVKNLHDDETYFMYRVTTDGGKVITVRRSRKHFSDYLTLRALINLTEETKKLLDLLSDEQKAVLKVKLALELSRAVIGYKTDAWLAEDLWIFKHIPISSSLNEETVINTIWELEGLPSWKTRTWT
jgi:hypothetical protein